MPILPVLLAVALLVVLGALSVYALVELSGVMRRRLGTTAGEDTRVPDRLGALTARLVAARTRVLDQVQRLRASEAALAEKPGRDELVARYSQDRALLEARAAHMEHVLGLVWKSEAVLRLRAQLHKAIRGRPSLDAVPSVEQAMDAPRRAAVAYERGANLLRGYGRDIAQRRRNLGSVLPPPPFGATLSEGVRAEVAREQAEVEGHFDELLARLDALADTMAYLAERSRTADVVAHATAPGLDGEVAFAIPELSETFSALDAWSAEGDRQLADTALDRLSEDITQLEQAGLEAKAATDAALEVARLLERAR